MPPFSPRLPARPSEGVLVGHRVLELLRGDDVRRVLGYVAAGGPIQPLSTLAFESDPSPPPRR